MEIFKAEQVGREGVLRELDRNGHDESRYLRPIQEIVSRDITPAEELLEKFHGPWGGSVEPAFEEFAY